jgi:hypothetical protein
MPDRSASGAVEELQRLFYEGIDQKFSINNRKYDNIGRSNRALGAILS